MNGETANIIQTLAKETATQPPLEIGGTARLIRKAPGVLTEIVDVEKYLPVPPRIRETPSFADHQSFITYVETFKATPQIFFDDGALTFTAVLDYCEAADKPSWGTHIASLKLRYSDEWTAWFEQNGKSYGQVGFGRFIEENRQDIASPDGATLLEMVMTFEATKTAAFKSAQRIKDGRVQFQYSEEINTGAVEVPEVIMLKIPVFLGQAPRDVEIRLRYRIEEGKLALHYDFSRAERIIREACGDVITAVRTGTTVAVLMGKRK